MSSMAIKYNMQKRAKKAGGAAVMPDGEPKDSDMVGRVMKRRMSEGGVIANDTPPVADGESADYDVMDTDDDLSMTETGANSGDELGDDRVSRAMKRRKGTA
jgi:hypothetical protein